MDLVPYTADERKTLQRCKEGEPVSAADLLMAVSTAMLLMQDLLNGVYELAPPGNLSGDVWDNLNNLYSELPDISGICQRWRAEYTGEPQRKVVVWEPAPPPITTRETRGGPRRAAGGAKEGASRKEQTVTIKPTNAWSDPTCGG